jgi:hypothetical protein
LKYLPVDPDSHHDPDIGKSSERPRSQPAANGMMLAMM